VADPVDAQRSPTLWTDGCERSRTQTNETTTETRADLCLIRAFRRK
jgi:hypothetical protein